MKHTVKLDDKDYTISTIEKSQTLWVAGGDYMGKPLYVQDRSEAGALKRWREAAQSLGN